MASAGPPASRPQTLERPGPWPTKGVRQGACGCAHVPATQRRIEARAAAARRLAAGGSGGAAATAATAATAAAARRRHADCIVASASSSSSSSSATTDSNVASALAGLRYKSPNGRWHVRPMNKADAAEVRPRGLAPGKVLFHRALWIAIAALHVLKYTRCCCRRCGAWWRCRQTPSTRRRRWLHWTAWPASFSRPRSSQVGGVWYYLNWELPCELAVSMEKCLHGRLATLCIGTR